MIKKSLFHTIAALTLTLATTVGMLGVAAPSASAWQYSQPYRQGTVTLPTVYVADLIQPAGNVAFTLMSNTGPVAYRSPATTGVQTVNSRYYVQIWTTGGWANSAHSPLMTGQLNSGLSTVTFPRAYLQPLQTRGYFRVTWAFDWYSNGSLIGSTSVVSHLTSDHVCVTQSRLCQSSAGYVRTGGYRTNSW